MTRLTSAGLKQPRRPSSVLEISSKQLSLSLSTRPVGARTCFSQSYGSSTLRTASSQMCVICKCDFGFLMHLKAARLRAAQAAVLHAPRLSPPAPLLKRRRIFANTPSTTTATGVAAESNSTPMVEEVSPGTGSETNPGALSPVTAVSTQVSRVHIT